uniref:Sushi domain-containing protein n=1 Tax=Chromera velia CCMP2878 TaxID=1169474 RepID=A0A0G4FUZ6_9ALVE|eukprot:Cvel_18881.t1-p1 / transcript=Cvel_18881.t1 / gene=Cvel_18881 / organism=Chromera_velia_CCMP2878 / gene_product=hypothetical protein / transcript_product=hypothetical protein / location=Cvel_scaffold1590:4-18719(+) / protein_length=1217 / sequence_SO=supercontig / SO=protein_coding / is_pseudo=false
MSLAHGDTRVVACVASSEDAPPGEVTYEFGYADINGEGSRGEQRMACLDGHWTAVTLDCRKTCGDFSFDVTTMDVADFPGPRFLAAAHPQLLPRFFHGAERHYACRHGLHAGLNLTSSGDLMQSPASEKDAGRKFSSPVRYEEAAGRFIPVEKGGWRAHLQQRDLGGANEGEKGEEEEEGVTAAEALGLAVEDTPGVLPVGVGSMMGISECVDGNFSQVDISCKEMCHITDVPLPQNEMHLMRLNYTINRTDLLSTWPGFGGSADLSPPSHNWIHHSSTLQVHCRDDFDQSPLDLGLSRGPEGNRQTNPDAYSAAPMDANKAQNFVWCLDGKFSALPFVDCYRRCPSYTFDDGGRQEMQEPAIEHFDPHTGTWAHRSEWNVWCKPGHTGVIPDFEEYERRKAEEKEGQLPTFEEEESEPPLVTNLPLKVVRNETLTCMDGHWEHQGMRCRADCPTPKQEPGGIWERYVFQNFSMSAVAQTKDGRGMFPTSTILTVVCAKGFSGKQEGGGEGEGEEGNAESQDLQCLDGVFERPTLECKRSCDSIDTMFGEARMRDPEAYRMTGVGTAHGDAVFVSCMPGYTKIAGDDPNKMVCDDGDWVGQSIVCNKECMSFRQHALFSDPELLPRTDEDGQFVMKYIIFGEPDRRAADVTVTIACAPGFAPILVSGSDPHSKEESDSEETLQCLKGAWRTRSLHCEKMCMEPFMPPRILADQPFSEASKPFWRWPLESEYSPYKITGNPESGEGVATGYRVQVECTTGYASTGPNERDEVVCINGQWSALGLECEKGCPPIAHAYVEGYTPKRGFDRWYKVLYTDFWVKSKPIMERLVPSTIQQEEITCKHHRARKGRVKQWDYTKGLGTHRDFGRGGQFGPQKAGATHLYTNGRPIRFKGGSSYKGTSRAKKYKDHKDEPTAQIILMWIGVFMGITAMGGPGLPGLASIPLWLTGDRGASWITFTALAFWFWVVVFNQSLMIGFTPGIVLGSIMFGLAIMGLALAAYFLHDRYLWYNDWNWSATVSTSYLDTYGYVCRNCDPSIRHVRRFQSFQQPEDARRLMASSRWLAESVAGMGVLLWAEYMGSVVDGSDKFRRDLLEWLGGPLEGDGGRENGEEPGGGSGSADEGEEGWSRDGPGDVAGDLEDEEMSSGPRIGLWDLSEELPGERVSTVRVFFGGCLFWSLAVPTCLLGAVRQVLEGVAWGVSALLQPLDAQGLKDYFNKK